MIAESTLRAVEDVAIALKELRERPYGPEYNGHNLEVAQGAFKHFCDGNPDQARTLWRVISAESGGYMPQVVVRALVRASLTTNLVPDVTAPDPS